MKKKDIWLGYLDAGSKSSAVVIDNRLDTGKPDTQYIYNLSRGEILEYKRELVSSKLRELTEDESQQFKSLKASFDKARKSFTPRVSAGRLKLEASAPRVIAPAYEEADNDEELDIDDIEMDAELDEA